MQTGFLCLEAGTTRSKNRINVTIKNLTDLCVSVIIFWAVGYGLMFGNSLHGNVGVDRFFPNLGENQDMWTGSFFLFQAMFCSTAVTILSGATAERIQFRGYLAISAVISGLIYPVFGHWVWQGIDSGIHSGWLAQRGFIDFAGSSVVHSLGGWCSLAAVLVIGPRIGRFSVKRQFESIRGTDVPLAFLGTMLLWFGWFGFNGGSNLVFNNHVSNIIANTLLAGTAGVLTPIALMSLRGRPIEVTPIMNGAIAGLVAVTAGCHAYSSTAALAVGSVGSLMMMLTTSLLTKAKIDDVVGAIPIHLAAGTWGTLAVGLLGNLHQLNTGLNRIEQVEAQLAGILSCALWSFGVCFAAVIGLQKLGVLRVSAKQEYLGLNISEHGTTSTVEEVYRVMRHHAKTGDLKRRVKGDSFTEVGRVGQWYNQVIVALETAVATNEAIIQTAVDSILTLSSKDLTIQSANKATQQIFGHSPAALIGQPLHCLFVPKTKLSLQQLTVVATAKEPETFIGQHQNGRTFPLEITATKSYANRQQFFTVFLKDISVRQRTAEALMNSRAQARAKSQALETALSQLRETQAQLIQRERIAGQGQLVAGVAHHINNPVNFIYGNLEHAKEYIQELLEAIATYEQYEQTLSEEVRSQLQEKLEATDIAYIRTDYTQLFQSMQTGTERIRTIVQQLRNFSRYDEAELKTIDFHTSLESALAVLAYRLEATSQRPAIEVIKNYGEADRIECYASAINRAVLNLLCNAIDAIDRQAEEDSTQPQQDCIPQIIIHTQAEDRTHLTVTLSNNGQHIPKDELKQIFDPFFTTQAVGQGAGLGCTISYQIIVQQHRGQLKCASAPGELTCFELTIPLSQSPDKGSNKYSNKCPDELPRKIAQTLSATPLLLESSLT